MPALSEIAYLSFPFRIDEQGPDTSSRADHVREQIAQVLFTSPKERVFRPQFGVGVRRLVFEPNGSALWNITHKQLTGSLAEALHGEVDPKTLEISVEREDASLIVRVSYTLAAINQQAVQSFTIDGAGSG